MMPRKKRRMILVCVIIAILLIILVTCLTLYATTDMFKSNDVLFNKYASQLLDNIDPIFNEDHMAEMEEILANNKLSSNTTVNVQYAEDGNTDNPVNLVQMNITGQQEETAGYKYRNISLVQGENQLVGVEYVEENGIAGIRLNGISQYVATNIEGEDENEVRTIYDIVNTDVASGIGFNAEESRTLKDKYLQLIVSNAVTATYSKQTGVTLEINGTSYQTNAYGITMTKEHFNNVYIKVLEEMQKDEIILSKLQNIDNAINQCYSIIQNEETSNIQQEFIDKISETIEEIQNTNIGNEERTIRVYETNGVAIGLAIETEEITAGFNVINSDEGQFIQISENEKTEEDEEENSFELNIQKTPQTNNEEIIINCKQVVEGEETTTDFTINRQMENSQVNCNMQIDRTAGENQLNISIDTIIDIINNFEEKETLTENENYIIYDNLTDEQKESIRNTIGENVQNQLNTIEQVASFDTYRDVLENVGVLEKELEMISNEGITEAERTRFNSNFELFTGENISVDRVKELMEFAKGNLADIRITQYQEQRRSSDARVPLEYRLIIERNTDNSELAESFISYIEGQNYRNGFNVRVEYDESTGLVSDIYITVNTL